MAKPPSSSSSSSSSSLIDLHASAVQTGYFKCNTCFTHVARNQNVTSSITPSGVLGWSFPSLVNVEIFPRVYVANQVEVEADVQCKGCNNLIGWKLRANQRNAGILVLDWEKIKIQVPNY